MRAENLKMTHGMSYESRRVLRMRESLNLLTVAMETMCSLKR
jgi:hypothetical protein